MLFIDSWLITFFPNLILHSLGISDLIFLKWASESLTIFSCIVLVGQDRHPRWDHNDESRDDIVKPYVNVSYLNKRLPISKGEKRNKVHLIHPWRETVEKALAWILVPILQTANMAMSCCLLLLNFQVCKIRGERKEGLHQDILKNIMSIGIFSHTIFLDYILLISIALYKSFCKDFSISLQILNVMFWRCYYL